MPARFRQVSGTASRPWLQGPVKWDASGFASEELGKAGAAWQPVCSNRVLDRWANVQDMGFKFQVCFNLNKAARYGVWYSCAGVGVPAGQVAAGSSLLCNVQLMCNVRTRVSN